MAKKCNICGTIESRLEKIHLGNINVTEVGLIK